MTRAAMALGIGLSERQGDLLGRTACAHEGVHNAKQNGICVEFTLGARGYAALLAGTLCALAVVCLALSVAHQLAADSAG